MIHLSKITLNSFKICGSHLIFVFERQNILNEKCYQSVLFLVGNYIVCVMKDRFLFRKVDGRLLTPDLDIIERLQLRGETIENVG